MNFLQSNPGDDPVILSGLFNASPARLFRAWTDPEELRRWFGIRPFCLLSANVDLRVGGQWRFVLEDSNEQQVSLEGEYLTIEPERKLVFSWMHVKQDHQGQREATRQSQVSVTFTQLQNNTRIDLRHEAIQAEDGRLGVGKGWTASLTSLAAICEQTSTEVLNA